MPVAVTLSPFALRKGFHGVPFAERKATMRLRPEGRRSSRATSLRKMLAERHIADRQATARQEPRNGMTKRC